MRPERAEALRPTARRAIVEAAIGLWSVNPGATLHDVAVRAGVGRATLHRHFQGRDALLAEVARTCIDEMRAAVGAVVGPGASARERLRGMFEAVIPLGDRYSFLQRESVADEEAVAGYRAQLDWVAALVADLKTEGDIAADVPSAWVVGQIDQLVWTAWNETARGRVAAADAASLAVRTLLEGLGERT
ncbi:MAG: TetR/AcrR family transcriptional regulator [Gammaproteobacteria bacterium]|nr:TetR/AcrR family transcriptional regulator [Gammaproteobacteria bacterium]